MTWDYTIKLTDLAIVFATVAGPILAVQAQKWLERHRAVVDRRTFIFRILMATRATRLSPGHVEALNAIPVEFHGRNKKLKAIIDQWHTYLNWLNKSGLDEQVLTVERQKSFIDMLHAISTYLGYSFTRTDLENDVYYPNGHVLIEDDQQVIRRGFAQLLKGEISIPMAVKEFPVDAQALANQVGLQKALLEWLEGQRVVEVRTSTTEPAEPA